MGMKTKTSLGVILALLMTSMLTLALNIQTAKSDPGVLFSDNFDDGVADGWTEHMGTWSVISGEYRVSVPGIVENGLSIVDSVSLTDYIIEAKLKFTDAVGFRAEIVFRYTDNEHYYTFGLSNEYDGAFLAIYSPGAAEYGDIIAHSGGDGSYPTETETEYLLRVEIQGDMFRGLINGMEVCSGTDATYDSGKVGLKARRAIVFFDDFTVHSVEPSTESDLVGYWKLDEGTGTTAYDSSEYGNDGTLINGPLWVDGKYGKALSFDGVNDYVEIPHSTSLNIANEITVEAWVKPHYTDYGGISTRVIVGKHGGWHNRGWSIGAKHLDLQDVRFHWQAETDNYLDTSTNPLSTGVWTYVVGVANGTHIKIYINGELSALKANAESVDYNYPVEIGRNGVSSGSFFKGIIDEVRIYNRALTEEEIREHYGIVEGRELSIKLSGDFDYASKEKIKVKLAALVKDA